MRLPTVIVPAITCMPPTISTRAVPRIVVVATIRPKSPCFQVTAIRAFIVVAPAAA